MKKTRRILLTLAALVVVVVLAVVIVAVIAIDAIAKRGVEEGATYALDVPSTLAGINVGILSGTVDMTGLEVSNPEGFPAPHFLALGEGGVAVTLGSLTKDVVNIPELRLHGIDVHLQQRGGKSNMGVILDNLGRFEKESDDPPAGEPAPGKKFIVEKIDIRDVRVHVDPGELVGSIVPDIVVPEIQLTNVGSDGSGVTLADLTNIIVQAIVATSLEAGVDVLPGELANSLQGGLDQLSTLGDLGVQMTSDLGAAVDDAAKQAQDAVGEAGKQASEALEDIGNQAGEGLKNLLGGDDDG
jgi:hypothetical protein